MPEFPDNIFRGKGLNKCKELPKYCINWVFLVNSYPSFFSKRHRDKTWNMAVTPTNETFYGVRTLTRKYYCLICEVTWEIKTFDISIAEALRRPDWLATKCGHSDHLVFRGLEKGFEI